MGGRVTVISIWAALADVSAAGSAESLVQETGVIAVVAAQLR